MALLKYIKPMKDLDNTVCRKLIVLHKVAMTDDNAAVPLG